MDFRRLVKPTNPRVPVTCTGFAKIFYATGCTYAYIYRHFSRERRVWRRERDSNPRRAFDPYALSRGAPSTTRPSLRLTQTLFFQWLASAGAGRGRCAGRPSYSSLQRAAKRTGSHWRAQMGLSESRRQLLLARSRARSLLARQVAENSRNHGPSPAIDDSTAGQNRITRTG